MNQDTIAKIIRDALQEQSAPTPDSGGFREVDTDAAAELAAQRIMGRLEHEPHAETYDRIADAVMYIGGAPVVWEALQIATPRKRGLRRLIIWMSDEDYQKHVGHE